MRYLLYISVLILAVIGTAAQGQDAAFVTALQQIPECPLSCILKASANSTCPITDQKCMCKDAQLQSVVQACILKTCTIKEALTTQNVTSTLCGTPVRSKQQSFRVMNITLIVISSCCVVARIFYKLMYTMAEIGWDDYCIIATLVTGLPSVILNDVGTLKAGLGLDIWTLTFTQITDFVKYVYITEVLYFTNLMFLRLSILFFYARIFSVGKAVLVIRGTMIFNVLFGVACTLAAIFQCQPVDHFWLLWSGEHKGKCINVNALGWSNASIGIALDLWMLAIPISQIKKLQLPLKKKIAACLMFMVGTFVTIVSILRLNSLTKVNSMNPTMDQEDSIRWSTIEVNVGIMCACMPTLRMILIRVFPKLGGTRTDSGRYYYNQKYFSRRKVSHSLGDSWGTNAEKGQNSQVEQDVIIEEDMRGKSKTSTLEHCRSQDDEVELVPMDDYGRVKFGP